MTPHESARRPRPLALLSAVLSGTLVALAAGAPGLLPAAAQEEGLTTWVPTGTFASSSLERVPQEAGEAPAPAPAVLELRVARNAPTSAQLAVTAHEELADLTAELRAGAPEGTQPVPLDAVAVRYPGYVPLEGTEDTIADPLLAGPVDVAAGHNQAIWLTVEAPAGLAAGQYGAQVAVSADGVDEVVHDLVVDVADVTLPEPADYDFYLNLWAQPDAVAYHHDVPVFSEEHWELLEPYLADLATRGQKVINAAIIEDPWELHWPDGSWSAQTYYPFHSLVDWSYDGADWAFDYTSFDRYVEASLEAGVGPDIRVYALLLFGGRERLHYEDTRTGETVSEVVQLGSERWREAWTAFLGDFEDHLRDRGWFEHTMLAFDERPKATMDVVMGFLEESAPAFADKVHIAVHSMDVDHTLPDVSYIHGLLPELSEEVLAERRAAGLTTTFYNVFAPLVPNTLTASPPVSARLLPWVPEQYGLDGYLRWTYNSWPSQDPYTDPAFRYTQGDEYIVYPGEDGPVSSIRWENFRDGVVDHELLTELARRAGAHNAAYREALAMVDANRQPSPELFADVVAARTLVLDELERFGGVAVTATADPDTAVAGDEIDVEVSLRNEGDQPLEEVRIELAAPEGWEAVADDDAAVAVAPGETRTVRFAVTVPAFAASGTAELTAALSFARAGEAASLEAVVPVDVTAAVGILDVSTQAALERGEEATVGVTVVNRLPDGDAAGVITLTGPEGWSVEPQERGLELAPGEQATVTFRAQPDAQADPGRTVFTAAVAVADRVVEEGTAVTFYNETALPVTLHSVSSEETVGEEGHAEHLVDGDPLTHWHSRWFEATDPYPHEVVLDLGAQVPVHALTYLPRQTGTLNGTVADYAVYVGDDAADWAV